MAVCGPNGASLASRGLIVGISIHGQDSLMTQYFKEVFVKSVHVLWVNRFVGTSGARTCLFWVQTLPSSFFLFKEFSEV